MKIQYSLLFAILLLLTICNGTAWGQTPRTLTIQEAKDKLAAQNLINPITQKIKAEAGQVSICEKYGDPGEGEIILIVENLESKREGRSQLICLIEEGGQKRSLNLIQKPDGSLLEWNGNDLVNIDLGLRFGCIDQSDFGSKCYECHDKVHACNINPHVPTVTRIQCILKVFQGGCKKCKDEYFNVIACLFN